MPRLAIILASAAALGLAAISSPAAAQQGESEQIAADWYNVIFVKFKAGKRDRAEEIIETYYAPAGEAANLPKSMLLHMNTGEWDMIRIGPMAYGPGSMAMASDPLTRRWRQEFERLAGGKKQADAIDAEFATLVANRVRHIAHVDRD